MTVFLLWEHMMGRPESERRLNFIFNNEKAAQEHAQDYEDDNYFYTIEEWEVQEHEG